MAWLIIGIVGLFIIACWTAYDFGKQRGADQEWDRLLKAPWFQRIVSIEYAYETLPDEDITPDLDDPPTLPEDAEYIREY